MQPNINLPLCQPGSFFVLVQPQGHEDTKILK